MKKINVIFQNNNREFLKVFLEKEKVDFEIFNVVEYRNSDKFLDNVKNNDLDELKKDFNAQIFQSVDENIPTRLLIPSNFLSKEDWQKEYSLYHELGHYYSLDKDWVRKYHYFLEGNSDLKGELFKFPLEVEAEKYVFKNQRKLFKKNVDKACLNYLNQIKNQIGLISEKPLKILVTFMEFMK